MIESLQNIYTYFKNLALNSLGVERDLYQLIADKDIDGAIRLMRNRDEDVDEAIREYNVQTHAVMFRPNKERKNMTPYITEKLPRTRQRYINEVELFFLLGSPIVWSKKEGSDEAFALFKKFMAKCYFDSTTRQLKRYAGAETEAAKLYDIRRGRDGKLDVNAVVLSREKGFRLRPLFDQFGKMQAFAYGYKLKEQGRTVEHWDIQTRDVLYYCKRSNTTGTWDIQEVPNPTGKINIIYAQQPKAWDGAEMRIAREEMLDSKTADTNNYFSDPIAAATADVIENMMSPESVGKMIQLTGAASKFEYIQPPQSSELRTAEKRELKESILFDTLTPDLSWENLKGVGTLTGNAIKNSMILGFIKRDLRKETYRPLVAREVKVVTEILKLKYPEMAVEIDDLSVDFEFGEPFASDKRRERESIATLYSNGVASLDTAVQLLALTDSPKEEVDRIQAAQPPQAPKDNKTAKGGADDVTQGI